MRIRPLNCRDMARIQRPLRREAERMGIGGFDLLQRADPPMCRFRYQKQMKIVFSVLAVAVSRHGEPTIRRYTIRDRDILVGLIGVELRAVRGGNCD